MVRNISEHGFSVLSGIFLLPVTMQSHQIKISRNRKQIQQCAVENGTLFSCISFRTRYDESVTKKKERTPSRQRHCSLLRSLLRSNRSRSSMLMIRRFSIFCKLNEIKFSDRKWFEDAAGMPLPPDQPCPYCLSKGTLRLFGHYNRYLVEWDGNTQKMQYSYCAKAYLRFLRSYSCHPAFLYCPVQILLPAFPSACTAGLFYPSRIRRGAL